MAMLLVKCGSFYILLAVFAALLGISGVLCKSDFHFYETDSTHDVEDSAVLLLLDEQVPHTYRKRDISPQPKPAETLVSTLNETTTSAPTTGETSINSSKKKTIKKFEKPAPVPISNITLPQHIMRNLGENGTGIRLNVTTVPPPLVHKVDPPISTHDDADEDDDDDDVDEDLDPEGKKFKETLKNHNITTSKRDPNRYYNSTLSNDTKIGQFYWVNMTNRKDVKVNDLLSQSHRRAATVKLSFEFPFYGHLIKNVTIATGGFLYTGDYVHSWLAATQYIAPLMANFDTSLSNDSFVKYVDNGTAFTVEWDKVALQDRPKDGEFTFQVTLYKNGDIVFVYQNVPVLIDDIKEIHHPVKVGLSDAYIMDQTIFLVRRKTIYEYDRVHFNKTEILNWTSIYLKALPTCLDNHDCTSCLTRNISFECYWCPTLNKCSEGFDRNRQDWLAQGCDKKSYRNASLCMLAGSTIPDPNTIYNDISNSEHDDNLSLPEAAEGYSGQMMFQQKTETVGASGIIAILFLVALTTGTSMWLFYAYRNPHTTSGQMLIRYRPSQWSWRRGEARYTAATIHM